jgi:hypothetical protein
MPRLSIRLADGEVDRLKEIRSSRSYGQTDTVIWLINQEHARQMGARRPQIPHLGAFSPLGKNNNTLSLSKNPTLKAGKNSDKDAWEPKTEKETPPA